MLPRGEPLTVPEVHYRVKHSPYKSELVRYGQFIFNDASWGLQGEYACASCHYERGQTTGLAWDLEMKGWGKLEEHEVHPWWKVFTTVQA